MVAWGLGAWPNTTVLSVPKLVTKFPPETVIGKAVTTRDPTLKTLVPPKMNPLGE
jgi:hypothetical protein